MREDAYASTGAGTSSYGVASTEGAGTAESPSMHRQQVRIMGAAIDAVGEAQAVETILGAALVGQGHWTITANLDHLRRYNREPLAQTLIDKADLVLADGTPLVWASRLAGVPLPGRVAGSNMIWALAESASERGISMFLLGGDPGIAEKAASVLCKRCPNLRVAGTLCPPLGYEQDRLELERIERALCEAAPQIVLVGLGFPKQDLLIERLREVLPSASFVGVGISFSFVAGAIPRAPEWMHGLGLEWLHRLRSEPRRLFRRYLVEGLPFALLLFASAIGFRLRRPRARERWGWDAGA